jgi:GNAT superfamily N-acetyltransferase
MMPDTTTAVELSSAPRRLGGLRGVTELLRVEGPLTFLKHAMQTYASPFVSRFYFFEYDLARAAQMEADVLPPGVTARIFRGIEELESLVAILAQTGMSRAEVTRRMALGDIVALAMAGDELVGYTWATSRERWVSEIKATVFPRADEIVQYDKRVMPKWRGQGLQYAISGIILPHLARMGYKRTLGWVDALNTRSLKNQRRLGKRKIAGVISIPALRIMRVRNYSDSDMIRIERGQPRR